MEVPRGKRAHVLNCWILPGGVHDLVLGNHFLKMTKTLTKCKGRIILKLVELPRRLRLRILGQEKQRLWGRLNGHLTAARKIGLTIARDFENWHEVEFADGTTDWTIGVLRDMPRKVGQKTVRCDFHVLDDVCVDVILSKDYLFDLNVFTEHGEYFLDTNSEEGLLQLCNI